MALVDSATDGGGRNSLFRRCYSFGEDAFPSLPTLLVKRRYSWLGFAHPFLKNIDLYSNSFLLSFFQRLYLNFEDIVPFVDNLTLENEMLAKCRQ